MIKTKKFDVVMVDSGKRSEFGNRLRFNSKGQLLISNAPLSEATDQYLYAISNDEIREGDWYINSSTHEGKLIQPNPVKCGYMEPVGPDRLRIMPCCKKIVATTDKSFMEYTTIREINGFSGHIPLPQLRESFMDDYATWYNRKQPIVAINLEVEQLCCQTGSPCGMPCNGDCEVNGVTAIKTDKEGYAIVVPIKKEMHTTAEVADQIRAYREFAWINGISAAECEKWIKENL